jgi:lactate permease
VLSALISLACIILFVQVWKPRDLEEYRASFTSALPGVAMGGHDEVIPRNPIDEEDIPAQVEVNPVEQTSKPSAGEAVRAWLPWVLVALVVILWTLAAVANVGASPIKWPGLHNLVFLTLYKKPYAAIYNFQPLGTGTAILVTVVLTAIALGLSPALFLQALTDTWKQLRFAILTVVLIIGLAYLYNYSGMVYTLGLAISSVGAIFPFFSVFLGWIACFLSGSDTSSNALFGNLQVVAARQLKLSPILMAATNSSGAVMGKMVSPQNVTTGVSTTDLVGKEGLIVRRTIVHSLVLACVLGVIVMIQQYLIPGIIPR